MPIGISSFLTVYMFLIHKLTVVFLMHIGYNKINLECATTPVILNLQIL